MQKQVKNILVSLVVIVSLLCNLRNGYGQPTALHDSLRHKLKYFYDTAKDDKLKQAVKEAQALYTTNAIMPLLSKKLLLVDSALIATGFDLNKPMVLSFAETLPQVLQNLPPPQENSDYARSLNNLANLYRAMGQYEKALPLYHQAFAIRKKVLGEAHPDYASSLNNLANLYGAMGQYEKALPLYQQAFAFRKKVLGEAHPDYARSLTNLANLYRGLGQYEKALPLLQQVLAIRKKVLGEAHPDYASSLVNLANLYRGLGQYEKALSLLQQAFAITKKTLGEAHPDYVSSLSNLATLYGAMGQYEKALPLFQQVFAIRKKVLGEAHPDYARSLNNLALFYYGLGLYEKALPLLQQALAIRKKVLGEAHPDYASSLVNLANLYRGLGQYEKGLSLYQQAFAVTNKVLGQAHPVYSSSLANLANLYGAMGQYEKALPLYQQALAVTNKILGEAHPDYASSLTNLANLYGAMGQYEKALPLYQQALAVTKKTLGEEHPDYAKTLNHLGALYINFNQEREAEPLLTLATSITLQHLKRTYSTLSEQEKLTFLKTKTSEFGYLPSLLSAQRHKEPSLINQVYTNELTLKSMVLQDQQQVLSSIRKSGDTAALRIYEQWRFNKASLGKQLLLPITKRLPYLDSLQEVTNQLEQLLSRRSEAFRNVQQSQGVRIKDIAAKLTKGEAAIEFISFRFHQKKWTDRTLYAALVLLSGDSNACFVPLFAEQQLHRLLQTSSKRVNVKTIINKLYPGITDGSDSPAYKDSLYHLIWQPLEKYLEGIHTVYYAPAGLLHRVAFAALQVNASHLLVDNYQLNQVLSTGSIAQPSLPAQALRTASLWGNIDYSFTKESLAKGPDSKGQSSSDTSAFSFNFYTSDSRGERAGGWNPLPYSKVEVDSLKKIMVKAGITVAASSGVKATEEAFKALDGNSSQVMHLATHGFFLPVEKGNRDGFDRGGRTFTLQQNPMFRSGLVLAGGNHAWHGKPALVGKEDGILTAYEIAQMDLSNTDLMVLSACGTALGDVQGNEGVIGLQRALKLAGVKQMLLSLWNVPDETTMLLMTMFYRNWLSGQSTREALRNAQLNLKQKYPPYFWAAFVIVE